MNEYLLGLQHPLKMLQHYELLHELINSNKGNI